jgi:hypothetical protein
VWQKLYEELREQDFMIVAVAMDSRGESAVRGPITKAGKSAKAGKSGEAATYTSLIDRDHLVAELYNMVNVPQAVWIDEAGRIVRPSEISGAVMSFNFRKIRRTREIYLAAIRDWVSKGAASEYVLSAEEARAELPAFTQDIAEAHAHFHLGRFLWEEGGARKRGEAADFLRRAVELHPDSWNFFRQMKNLEHILGSGGPEFMRRVRQARKAGRAYYPLPRMRSMQEVSD